MLDFNKLLSAMDATKTTRATKEDDSHEYWKPTVDKAGNGVAVIRFLPDRDLNQIPFVRVISFGFKNEENNRWYIENSLTTLGQSDPTNDLKGKWWNSNDPDEQEFARKVIKRRINFYSNILVISDPANPANDGKVFKFRYGQKIFDKIMAAAKPEFDDQDPINAWDPINGANFRLKIKQVAGYQNYDDSSFAGRKALFDGDQNKIDEVLSQCFDIQKLLAPENFKTADELTKKLKWVLGQDEGSTAGSVTRPATTAQAVREVDEFEQMAKATIQKETVSKPAPVQSSIDADDDDAFFRSLVED